MATRKTAAAVDGVEMPATVEETYDPEELVTVQLFQDNDKYKDDLYVAVNGERILIKRGIPVQIKRKFADVIKNSETQDKISSLMMQRMAEDFVRATQEKTKPV